MEAVRRASRGAMGASGDTFPDSRDALLLEVQDEEAQPLLRRPSRTQAEIEQTNADFQRAQQEAAQQAAMESGWFTHLLLLFAFAAFSFWFYVNVMSWWVLIEYYGSPCDQPLSQWLLTKLVLDVLSSSTQQHSRSGEPPRPVTWIILGLQNAWLVMGFNWVAECKTCQATSPELYHWVNFLVIFGTVVTAFLMLLPVIFYMVVLLFVHLLGTGRVKTTRAAREDTLDCLEIVEYSADLFADTSDPNDNRPAGDCCCCCEDFNAEKAIVATPCKHLFHKDCLGEWLKLARTCPICRSDLEVATEGVSCNRAVEAAGVLQEPASASSGGGVDMQELSSSSGGAGLAVAQPASSSSGGADLQGLAPYSPEPTTGAPSSPTVGPDDQPRPPPV